MPLDRAAGMVITIGYTVMVVMGTGADAEPWLIDAIPWIAFGLLIMAYGLYVIPDSSVRRLSGGPITMLVRLLALMIQIVALVMAGWWWTLLLRAAAELLAYWRVKLAWFRASGMIDPT